MSIWTSIGFIGASALKKCSSRIIDIRIIKARGQLRAANEIAATWRREWSSGPIHCCHGAGHHGWRWWHARNLLGVQCGEAGGDCRGSHWWHARATGTASPTASPRLTMTIWPWKWHAAHRHRGWAPKWNPRIEAHLGIVHWLWTTCLLIWLGGCWIAHKAVIARSRGCHAGWSRCWSIHLGIAHGLGWIILGLWAYLLHASHTSSKHDIHRLKICAPTHTLNQQDNDCYDY